MARINKKVNIPKGNNSDYDSIRDELIARLKEQNEQSRFTNQGNPQNVPSNMPINNNNVNVNNNNFSRIDNAPNNNFNGNVNEDFGVTDPYVQRSSIRRKPNNAYQNRTNQDLGSASNFNGSASVGSSIPNAGVPQNLNNNQNIINNNSNFQNQNINNEPFQNQQPNQGQESFYGMDNNFKESPDKNEDFATTNDIPAAPMAGRPSAADDMARAVHSVDDVTYKPKSKRSAGKTLIILLIMIAFIFAFSWLLREFVLQSYQISSGSMEKTLMTWDMVFAEKISPKMGKPKVGTIVTFDDPLISGRVLIKRVIATEGQVVDIKNNKLYIDGEEQDENYVNDLPTTKLSSSKISFPYTVPDHCVWVMGDNRTNSQDSRYFGAISEDSIIGRGMFVYWPLSNFKLLE